MGSSNRSSIRNILSSVRRSALELEADVHEVIRRPRASVAEVQTVSEALGDAVHGGVELGFAVALDQECCVHDHLLANRLVVARGHAHVAQCLVDLTNIL